MFTLDIAAEYFSNVKGKPQHISSTPATKLHDKMIVNGVMSHYTAAEGI